VCTAAAADTTFSSNLLHEACWMLLLLLLLLLGLLLPLGLLLLLLLLLHIRAPDQDKGTIQQRQL
jgi:hypothetical protein